MPKWRMGITLAILLAGALLSTSPGASTIPYLHAAAFAQNPMMAEVTLPPLPDSLHPMGPPKPLPSTIIAPLPPAEGPKNATNSPTAAAHEGGAVGKAETGETVVNGQSVPNAPGDASQTTVTTATPTPFLKWVDQNKDAAEVARAERNSYKNQPATSENPDEDLMLNIRYPYMWNQDQPPGGGAVIYTIKK